ncbi:hypothetical protein B9T38_10525 [Acinetobacter sp. ANC 4218]|jgi:hypothetical protein|nr:hypothetical protein B9T38_10525 [Acinetobacter sp. ANC 4218]
MHKLKHAFNSVEYVSKYLINKELILFLGVGKRENRSAGFQNNDLFQNGAQHVPEYLIHAKNGEQS